MGMFDDLIPHQQQDASLPPQQAMPSQRKAITFTDLIPQKADAAPAQPSTWSDVGSQALQNIPASAENFASGIYQSVRHPIDTLSNVGHLASGAIENIPGVATVNDWAEAHGLAPTQDKAILAADQAKASQVGQFYKDRYGSVQGLKNTIASDPVGVAGDLATVLTGGEGAAARIPGLARVASTMGTAAKVVNPLTVPAKAASIAGKATGGLGKAVLGATTGTSSATIGEAVNAGRMGGEYSKAFTDNMRGNIGQADVLEQAKQAIQNIADQRSAEYVRGMAPIKGANAPLNFAPIDKAMGDLVGTMREGNHWTVKEQTVNKLREIGDALHEWQADPSMHTAIGFDALKKRIDDLMPSFGPDNTQAARAVTTMRNAVKDTIVQQVPEYASVMKNYEVAKNLQTEIERSLSLGKKSSADTALRKLQSLTRNNVNTNYGSRVNSAKVLEAAGAKTLMPSLAGQALNTLVPRGLMGPIIAGGGLALGQFFNPAYWAAMAPASPRLVGEASHLAGATRRLVSKSHAIPSRRALLAARLLGGPLQPGQQ